MGFLTQVNLADIVFLKSVFQLGHLPAVEFPEIAFAGRSNVGKSSLINRLVNRKALVKVSARPGKTQSLNFFLVGQALYLVDLPGYGYARVSQEMQARWQGLITGYLETRKTLRGVVVIIDVRHAAKSQDLEVISWLRERGIPFVAVYTKIDKLSGNELSKQAVIIDSGLGVSAPERVLFSSKTGAGREKLLECLDSFFL